MHYTLHNVYDVFGGRKTTEIVLLLMIWRLILWRNVCVSGQCQRQNYSVVHRYHRRHVVVCHHQLVVAAVGWLSSSARQPFTYISINYSVAARGTAMRWAVLRARGSATRKRVLAPLLISRTSDDVISRWRHSSFPPGRPVKCRIATGSAEIPLSRNYGAACIPG